VSGLPFKAEELQNVFLDHLDPTGLDTEQVNAGRINGVHAS
jgi:hypothetical protein